MEIQIECNAIFFKYHVIMFINQTARIFPNNIAYMFSELF